MNHSIPGLLTALSLGIVLAGLAACGAGGDLDGGAGGASPASPSTPFEPAPPPAAWADDGCVFCHGPDGAGGGGGPDIRCTSLARLEPHVRDPLTPHAGGAFPDLTDPELADLVAFLRTPACPGTSPGDPTNPPPTGGLPLSHTESEDGVLHHPDYETNLATCTACHGANLEGSAFAPSCTSCHGRPDGGDDEDEDDED